MPPSEEKGSPAALTILRRGAKEMRAEGKKAGGREWSSSSRLVRGGAEPLEGEVKRSCREKSSEDQLSARAEGRWGGERQVAGDLGVAGRAKPSEEAERVRVQEEEEEEKGEEGAVEGEEDQLLTPEEDESDEEQGDMGELDGSPQLLLVPTFPPALHGATGRGRDMACCATSAR